MGAEPSWTEFRHAGGTDSRETGAQVALDGRDALGGNQVYPRRFNSCSCWFSLDHKPLKIFCGAVDVETPR